MRPDGDDARGDENQDAEWPAAAKIEVLEAAVLDRAHHQHCGREHHRQHERGRARQASSRLFQRPKRVQRRLGDAPRRNYRTPLRVVRCSPPTGRRFLWNQNGWPSRQRGEHSRGRPVGGRRNLPCQTGWRGEDLLLQACQLPRQVAEPWSRCRFLRTQ